MTRNKNTMLHLGNRFQAKDVECFVQDPHCCFTEEYPAHVHTDDLQCLAVTLNAVAIVIELGERRTELVDIVTQYVWKKVVHHLSDDLWKAYDALGQL